MEPLKLEDMLSDDNEAFCVHEHKMHRLQKQPTVQVRIQTIEGETIRKMVVCSRGSKRYLADRNTGTLYREDGSCCSSAQLRAL